MLYIIIYIYIIIYYACTYIICYILYIFYTYIYIYIILYIHTWFVSLSVVLNLSDPQRKRVLNAPWLEMRAFTISWQGWVSNHKAQRGGTLMMRFHHFIHLDFHQPGWKMLKHFSIQGVILCVCVFLFGGERCLNLPGKIEWCSRRCFFSWGQ